MSESVWSINPSEFPEHGSIEEKIKFWLRYAILAPSAHNTQPWRPHIQGNVLEIHRDPDHTLKAGDPTLRETSLGIGAFIENFCLAATHFGYEPTVDQMAQTIHDDLMATISFQEAAAQDHSPLFDAITKRHTNRGLYQPEPLAAEITHALEKLSTDDIKVFFITDPEAKERIAALVGKGNHIALSMQPMKEELADLVSRHHEQKETGMTVEAMTQEAPADSSGSDWMLHQFNPKDEAEASQQRFATTPLQIIIGSELDDPEAWLQAGRVLERILLTAAHFGLNHDISAAPVEVPTLTPRLRQEIDPTYRPQALLRVGKPVDHSFTHLSNRRNP